MLLCPKTAVAKNIRLCRKMPYRLGRDMGTHLRNTETELHPIYTRRSVIRSRRYYYRPARRQLRKLVDEMPATMGQRQLNQLTLDRQILASTGPMPPHVECPYTRGSQR